jgi:NAD(P)-dependent dehydrogenase (short-subunit alcohol dehydrogenase family)
MSPRTVPELFDISGKVALVTGASGHLGRELAIGLAEAGASVVAASRSAERSNDLARALPVVGKAKHAAVALDHLDSASIASGFADAVTRAGQIDILVNNGHQATTKTWQDTTAAEFTAQLANASGYFELAKAVRDHAVERQEEASIILLGSMYGIVSSVPSMYEGIGPGNPVAYHALKGGIIQMARHLAVHWARDGVRVNTLSPGPFPNVDHAPAELCRRLAERTPLGRLGNADELKGAVVFLASDASSYITGHNLVVDGGWTAW